MSTNQKYGLSFINDDDLFTHVKETIDKSTPNHLDYFHQNIFKYLGEQWCVSDSGYVVINEVDKVYAEIKHKYNSMNCASSRKTYIKMQHEILCDDNATCYLVELTSNASQDKAWEVSVDGECLSNKKIRCISIDKFYALVTGLEHAFKDLCEVIPKVIDDIAVEGITG